MEFSAWLGEGDPEGSLRTCDMRSSHKCVDGHCASVVGTRVWCKAHLLVITVCFHVVALLRCAIMVLGSTWASSSVVLAQEGGLPGLSPGMCTTQVQGPDLDCAGGLARGSAG